MISPARRSVISKMLWMSSFSSESRVPVSSPASTSARNSASEIISRVCGPPRSPRRKRIPPAIFSRTNRDGSDHAGERVERRGRRQREAAGPRPHEALRRHVPDQQDPERAHEKGDALADPGRKMRQEEGGDDRGDRHVDDLVPEEDRRDQPARLRQHLRDPLGPAVPLLLPLQKIHPAQGEQRRLRRGKECGGEEQEREKDRFHDGVSGYAASGPGSDRTRMEARRPRATNRPRAGRGSPRPSSPRRSRVAPEGKERAARRKPARRPGRTAISSS